MKKIKYASLIVAFIAGVLISCNDNNSAGNSTSGNTDTASASKDSTYGSDYNPATPGAQNGQ